MTGRALLALALAAVACGSDDPAGRDYTDAACPSAAASVPPEDRTVCDRGRGQSPRYVSIDACLAELRLRPASGSAGFNSTSPNYQRCRTSVSVITLDDVRNGQGLVAY